jgi:hypothetical protein
LLDGDRSCFPEADVVQGCVGRPIGEAAHRVVNGNE